MMIAIPILLSALSLGAGESPETSVTAPLRPRVIVYVNRSKNESGHVDFEDDEIIQIELRDGTHESWPKEELLTIIRLHDLPEPRAGVVILRSNQRHRGTIVRDGFDAVDMHIKGVPLTLARNRVSHVVLEPPLQEQYLERRKTVNPEDISSHLALCRWLVATKQYEHAQTELEQIQALHTDPESLQMLRLVEAQLKLHLANQDKEQLVEPGENVDPSTPGGSTAPRLLTEEEVNLLRVYEIDLQNPPRLLVPRDAIDDLIEQYGTSSLIPDTELEQAELYRADSLQIVRLLFRLRARDLYGRINVLSEPPALQIFRERVHDTWLMNNCSTTRCHGGTASGRLRLRRAGASSVRTRYTNLLVLDRFRTTEGAPILDWEVPEQSLLLQYGLPREETRTPHPDVPGWEPVFARSRHGHKFLHDGAVLWLQSMMNSPRPQYPIPDVTAEDDREPR